jgi:flagellar biosynthesis chaperone FliJ
MAAARVAGRSMLADLASLQEMQQQAVDEAQAAHSGVRREVRGLDRLAAAHTARVQAEALRAEQLELDEIAVRRGARSSE